MDLPNFIWRAIYEPRGERQRKLPEPPKFRSGSSAYGPMGPQSHYRPYIHQSSFEQRMGYHSGTVVGSSNGGFGTALTETRGEFVHSDYFQFYSRFGQLAHHNEWSMCRVCKTVCWGRQGRTIHCEASPDCRQYLGKAVKLLRRDHKCAVCNTPTDTHAHLIFLCSEACQYTWRHMENTGRTNLLAALTLSSCPPDLLSEDYEMGDNSYAC